MYSYNICTAKSEIVQSKLHITFEAKKKSQEATATTSRKSLHCCTLHSMTPCRNKDAFSPRSLLPFPSPPLPRPLTFLTTLSDPSQDAPPSSPPHRCLSSTPFVSLSLSLSLSLHHLSSFAPTICSRAELQYSFA